MKRFLLVIGIIVFCLPTFAAEKGKKPSLDERKAKVTANIERRISSLNDFKSCIGKASEQDQIKSCRDKHKATMDKMRAENPGRKRGKGRHRGKNH